MISLRDTDAFGDGGLQLFKRGRGVGVALEYRGLLEFDVLGIAHQHQVARGDRAPAGRVPQVGGEVRAHADAGQVAGKAFVGNAQRMQRQGRHQQDDRGEEREGEHQLRLDAQIGKFHGAAPG